MNRTLMALIASIGLSTLGGAAVFADEAPGGAKPAEATPATTPTKPARKKHVKKVAKPADDKKLDSSAKPARTHRSKGTPKTPVAAPAATTPTSAK
jgi:hypothetical protein